MQETPKEHSRWPLIRLAIIFQLKLGLDALRDVLMSPVSIVLAITDIVMRHNQQQSYFIRLMRLGQKSDRWINLFGVDSSNIKDEENETSENSNVDEWFSKIEEVIKEQQVDGQLSQSSKKKLQKYFGLLNETKDIPENTPDDAPEKIVQEKPLNISNRD